jgi:hypothetical protein
MAGRGADSDMRLQRMIRDHDIVSHMPPHEDRRNEVEEQGISSSSEGEAEAEE